MSAIVQCSQLGLEPGGVTGEAYLVPYWNGKKGFSEVQLIPGYRGLMKLARQSGLVAKIESFTVHKNDPLFEVELGLEISLRHRPLIPGDRGEMVAAYAVATLKDGERIFDVMSADEINRIKEMSLSKMSEKARDYAPWNKFYEEMARKTVVRRLWKYLPVSIELEGYDKIIGTMEKDREIDEGEAPEIILDIPQEAPPTEAQAELVEVKGQEVAKMRDMVKQGMRDNATDGTVLTALFKKTGIAKPEDVDRCKEISTLEDAMEILSP
jgi:recombination protein RecT